ncbi:MAG TPA: aminotransferase class V-fold PLP-dependent enzyme [Thermoanaerobaculia bacterium]|nr:aminotransferase class V-fold PLP-dependent enzyme [Thermoanaerobaculia bacterium]
MKEHWLLDPSVTFLNHGSFGATPKAVLAKQHEFRRRMELEPVRFLVRELEPLLDQVRADLANFIGAAPDDLAFVPNATSGVNAVLRSLEFSSSDELLVTNQEYNACRNTIDYVAARSGARVRVVEIPFPLPVTGDVFDCVIGSVTGATRLLLIDHITSQTAIIMPVERIVAELHARGIDTLIDGAHVAGQLPLDIRAIGAAYYTGNLHKWVCAPKGAAFLYVRSDRREGMHPIVISHGLNSTRTDRSRFHLEFDWPGTFDPTAWLAAGEALRFIPSLVEGGWPEVMRRNHTLALRARDILCHALHLDRPAPDDLLGSMAAFPIPDGKPGDVASVFGDPLQDALFDQYRIEVPVVPWPNPPKRLVRVSAQLYNVEEDYVRLAEALSHLLQS